MERKMGGHFHLTIQCRYTVAVTSTSAFLSSLERQKNTLIIIIFLHPLSGLSCPFLMFLHFHQTAAPHPPPFRMISRKSVV